MHGVKRALPAIPTRSSKRVYPPRYVEVPRWAIVRQTIVANLLVSGDRSTTAGTVAQSWTGTRARTNVCRSRGVTDTTEELLAVVRDCLNSYRLDGEKIVSLTRAIL